MHIKATMAKLVSKTSVRLLLSVLVLLAGFSLAVSFFVNALTADIYETRKNELQHIVSLAQSTLEPILAKSRSGEISLADARLQATEAMEHFVYHDQSGPNYVFLTTYEGYILVQPFEPDAIGTYQIQARDEQGFFITKELLQTAKAGGGFATYHKSRTSAETPQQKISYVIGLPEIDCFLGTGMYVGDIDRTINQLLYRLLYLGSAILTIVLGLQYYFLRPMLYGMSTLSKAFAKLGSNPEAIPSFDLNSYVKGTETEQLLRKFTDMANQLRQRDEQIRRLALFDSLTGLPNRIFLNDCLAAELDKAALGQSCGALMFLDLNNFKRVNDLFGHAHGDQVLMQIAGRLRSVLSGKGMIARLGGDEFVILVPGMQADAVEPLAQELVQRGAHPVTYQDDTFFVSSSIGIVFYPHDGCDADTLLTNADTAMYHAKESASLGYSRFSPAMQETTMKRIHLEGLLTKAIERNELQLHYQPQLDLATTRPVCLEALLRWQRPGMGSVSPAEFIPVAEESGLIIPIGYWVLRQACRFCQRLNSNSPSPIHIAVNVSAKQLEQPDFVATVGQILNQTSLPAHYLELEITESLLMRSFDTALQKLHQLKAMGVKLALDDFGAGYSSLTYLRHLPINVLKIDKEFVKDLQSKNSAIVEAIICLAHLLGIQVVAEGVEYQEQAEFLIQSRCDRVQGYFFSRPLDEAKVIPYLDSLQKGA